LKYGNIPLVAMLVYDLQKYHLDFSLAIVDQVLEDIRAGMEVSESGMAVGVRVAHRV
jgi:regulator of nonsense transcripts 2